MTASQVSWPATLPVQAVVLEDIFEISDKDPDGKKFDKGEQRCMHEAVCRTSAGQPCHWWLWLVSITAARQGMLPLHVLHPVRACEELWTVCSLEDQGEG